MTTATPRRGRPPRTAAQRASHRAELVRGAMDAIRRSGPDLSIDELAAGAGVSKPVIYGEFGGRVGVADAVAVALAGQVEVAAFQKLLAAAELDVSGVIDAIVDAFLTLVDEEEELYAFIVRTMRSDSRGLLDNALVRVLHDRASPVISALTPGIASHELAILTDGVYGFMLAAVESWKASKTLSRQAMVAMLGAVIREGLRVVASSGLTEPARSITVVPEQL